MRMYRRIALSFVLATAAILAAVVYASIVQATIRITPNEQEISSSFLVDVTPNPTEEGNVRGKVLSAEADISNEVTVQRSGEEAGKAVEGKSSGVITITNTRSVEQTLIATTRFLSAGGVLFRLDKTVTVPGKGKVEARITADTAGSAGDVEAGRFTIPGLSESVQTLIYGESTEVMKGGLRYVTILTQEDADAAAEDLKAKAVDQLAPEMRKEVAVFPGESFRVEMSAIEVDPSVGTETDRFSVKAHAAVTGVFFDEEELYKLAERLLYQDIERGLKPVGVDKTKLKIEVDRADAKAGTATLRVSLSGTAIPSAAHQALARGVFSGKTPEEVVKYFEDNNLAKTVEVELRPSWLRRVPRSQNKIKLLINETTYEAR